MLGVQFYWQFAEITWLVFYVFTLWLLLQKERAVWITQAKILLIMCKSYFCHLSLKQGMCYPYIVGIIVFLKAPFTCRYYTYYLNFYSWPLCVIVFNVIGVLCCSYLTISGHNVVYFFLQTLSFFFFWSWFVWLAVSIIGFNVWRYYWNAMLMMYVYIRVLCGLKFFVRSRTCEIKTRSTPHPHKFKKSCPLPPRIRAPQTNSHTPHTFLVSNLHVSKNF